MSTLIGQSTGYLLHRCQFCSAGHRLSAPIGREQSYAYITDSTGQMTNRRVRRRTQGARVTWVRPGNDLEQYSSIGNRTGQRASMIE
jgi:hypothetical protein